MNYFLWVAVYLMLSSLVYWLWMHQPHYGYLDWPYHCLVVFPVGLMVFGFFSITKNTRLVMYGLYLMAGLNFMLAVAAWLTGYVHGPGSFFWIWLGGFGLVFVLPGYAILAGFILYHLCRIVFSFVRYAFYKSNLAEGSGEFFGSLFKGVLMGFAIRSFLDREDK